MSDWPSDLIRTAPYAHQRDAFDATWNRAAAALFMDLGTGKSLVALATLAALRREEAIDAALVLAPKGTYQTWSVQEIPRHVAPGFLRIWGVTTWDPRRSRAWEDRWRIACTPDPAALRVLVMNLEALSTPRGVRAARAFCEAHPRVLAILDESTAVKHPSAARTKAALALRPLLAYRRILSGAPVTESPLDLYAPCAFLDPALLGFRSWYAYRARYAVLDAVEVTECRRCRHRPWEHERHARRMLDTGRETHAAGACRRCGCAGYDPRTVHKVADYQRVDELRAKLDRFAVRVRKEECLDLPPKVYARRTVELTREQRAAYTAMRDTARAELAGKIVEAPIVLAKLTRLHQIVTGALPPGAPPRIEALAAVLEECAGKAIVWAPYRADLEAITRRLRHDHGPASTVLYHGETKAAERPRLVERFQEDPGCRFFVGQPRTGGMGLTLTAASTVVYYASTWSAEVRIQSEDRAHRIGQHRSVTYVDLVAPGTIDEAILDALGAKRDLAAAVTDPAVRERLLS